MGMNDKIELLPPLLAVIDSGWDCSIQEPRVTQGLGYHVSGSTVHRTLDYHDRLGHGSAVASILLLMAPGARLIPLRVFGTNRETDPVLVAAAIRDAAALGARVVNLSLSTHRAAAEPILSAACAEAIAAGCALVASQPRGRGQAWPAACEGVIAVEAAPESARLFYGLSPDSPGVFCADAGSDRFLQVGNRLFRRQHASAAAPMIAALALGLLTGDPELSHRQVETTLREYIAANYSRAPPSS
jgi:subtilisin family serine protease